METVFHWKAQLYDEYRWRYSPEAINWAVQKSAAFPNSSVAVFGAGTGILKVELAKKFNSINDHK